MPKTDEVIVEQVGYVSKITSFLSTKKGMYLLIAILLVGAIYYYTSFSKDTKNIESTQNKNEEEVPQPPPGYVTIPVEMLEGLQQGAQYQQMPQDYNQPMNLQTQQQMEFNQPQMDANQEEIEMQRQMQMQQEMALQQQRRVPKLKHNKKIDDDDEEEEEIAEQNLSKDEMESIQAQLNSMQQQRNANNTN